MNEVWRDCIGWKHHQVSNFGNVRRLEYSIVRHDKSEIWTYKSKLYDLHESKCGYMMCGNRLVHRLVAQAFIPNPNNLSEVNHKDEDKTNNRVDNLEWCTHSYNNRYNDKGKRVGQKLKGRKLSDEHRQKIKDNNAKYWKGKHRDYETRKKLSENANIRRVSKDRAIAWRTSNGRNFTDDVIIEIYRRLVLNGEKQCVLAQEYNCSQSFISCIKRRKIELIGGNSLYDTITNNK